MAIHCTFVLNGKPMSALTCPGVGVFPAFSGDGALRNQPSRVNVKDVGPLPPGRYFIVDRPSGGRLGGAQQSVRDFVFGTDHSTWFALFRDDGTHNDITWIERVQRGAFRIHPVGPANSSQGCVTLAHAKDFSRLSAKLKAGPFMKLPHGRGTAYGTVTVR